MSDDLVKRLRTEIWDHEYKIQKDAADRIEQLEAALRHIELEAPRGSFFNDIARKALEGKDD